MNVKPKIIVFASGTAEGGGSGFDNVVTHSRTYAERTQNDAEDLFDYEVVAVVSNHEHGGVRERAERLGVPFIYFAGPYDAEHYASVLSSFAKASKDKQNTSIEWVALSGWLKQVQGLDPKKTFNIHPALLSQLDGPFDTFDKLSAGGLTASRFGGATMYGSHVLDAVYGALEKEEITEFGISMHFVTDEYDRGPVFFEFRIPYKKGMTKAEVADLVHKAEHEWQPKITNMVVHGEVRWDGKDPKSLRVPIEYTYLPKP